MVAEIVVVVVVVVVVAVVVVVVVVVVAVVVIVVVIIVKIIVVIVVVIVGGHGAFFCPGGIPQMFAFLALKSCVLARSACMRSALDSGAFEKK